MSRLMEEAHARVLLSGEGGDGVMWAHAKRVPCLSLREHLQAHEWRRFVGGVDAALRHFLAEHQGSEVAVAFDLPSAGARPLPAQRDMLVRRRGPSRLVYIREGDHILFQAEGVSYRFSQALAPVVERLSAAWTTFDALAAGVDRALAHAFLLKLWSDGVVIIADGREVPEDARAPRWLETVTRR